jgi:hypothetical protein
MTMPGNLRIQILADASAAWTGNACFFSELIPIHLP